MKFLIAFALLAVTAARILPADLNLTPSELAEVEEILAAIHSPSTDPTTAVMLEQMLYDILGLSPAKPPIQLPAIIDPPQGVEPPHVGPAIIDFPLPEGAIPVDVAPVAPAPAASSPLVQIIVNVNAEGTPVANPVQVDNVNPSPVVVVDKPKPEVPSTPVIVVDKPQVAPTPVQVVDSFPEPEPVIIGHLPEPVIVAPIDVAPVVVGPEILN